MSATNVVYLICLKEPLVALSGKKVKRSQHYMGSAADLVKRLAQHRSSKGSTYLREANKRNITYRVVRLWQGESLRHAKLIEANKKRYRNHGKFCPVCKGLITYPEDDLLETE